MFICSYKKTCFFPVKIHDNSNRETYIFFFYFPSQVVRNTKIQFKEFNKKKTSIQFQSSFSIFLFNFFLQYHSYKNIKIEDSVMAYSIYNKQYIQCTCKQTIYLLSCLYSIYCIKNWNLKRSGEEKCRETGHTFTSLLLFLYFYILSFNGNSSKIIIKIKYSEQIKLKY